MLPKMELTELALLGFRDGRSDFVKVCQCPKKEREKE